MKEFEDYTEDKSSADDFIINILPLMDEEQKETIVKMVMGAQIFGQIPSKPVKTG